MALGGGLGVRRSTFIASMALIGCGHWPDSLGTEPERAESSLVPFRAAGSIPQQWGQKLGGVVPSAQPLVGTNQVRQAVDPSGSVLGRQVQEVLAPGGAVDDAFASSESCLGLLRRGARVVRAPGTARVAAWNVRWFPDGVPGVPSGSSRTTDVEWLACVLAWLNVDAVALSEVKSPGYSAVALQRLLAILDELTNGRHAVHLDDCPEENGQHVAWLVNQQRVTATDWQVHAAVNPNGDACAGQLRPGLGVDLKFAGGLDLHAISVHLKSGVQSRDFTLRRSSLDGLEQVVASVTQRSGDGDLLVAGDFNTAGCAECRELSRSAAEASWLDNRLRAFGPVMRRIANPLGCSLYYERQPSLLDHFLVTSAMLEVGRDQKVTVYGHCQAMGCETDAGDEPTAAIRLSDHCPIVLSLLDQDMD